MLAAVLALFEAVSIPDRVLEFLQGVSNRADADLREVSIPDRDLGFLQAWIRIIL